jgi:hypothetical protein
MQIRSFASSTHNDKSFQYFAVDFGRAKSATHGSILLSEAAFVNEALAEISRIYEQMKGQWK